MQAICRRLSHTRLKQKYFSTMSNDDCYSTSTQRKTSPTRETTSANLFTECSKCKLSMSTYDYLLHDCLKNQKEENKSNYSPLNPSYRHNFRSSEAYDRENTSINFKNRKSFSSINSKNSTNQPTMTKSQYNLKNLTRQSRDTVNTSSSSSGLGASFSSANTSVFSSKPNATSKTSSNFVNSDKLNLDPSLNQDKIHNSESENIPNKTTFGNKISSAQKKSYNIKTDHVNDSKSEPLYTPIKNPSTPDTHGKFKTGSVERSKSPTKQSPHISTTSSMSFSPSVTKPFTSDSSPSYSKYSKHSSISGGITNILNHSYTGLKREKIRTGF